MLWCLPRVVTAAKLADRLLQGGLSRGRYNGHHVRTGKKEALAKASQVESVGPVSPAPEPEPSPPHCAPFVSAQSADLTPFPVRTVTA